MSEVPAPTETGDYINFLEGMLAECAAQLAEERDSDDVELILDEIAMKLHKVENDFV